MVSFTPSLHTAFGTNVVMGNLGFSFNCRGDYFSLTPGHANALAPGKRPRSTLQSTLVMKEGRPFMVLGSPGGDDQCLRTMQTFLNVVEFGMNVQEAIEAPRWSTRSFPQSPFPHQMYPGELTVEDTDSAVRARRAQAEGTQAEGDGTVVAGAECGDHVGSRDGRAERRGGSALRRLRAGVVSRGIRAMDGTRVWHGRRARTNISRWAPR